MDEKEIKSESGGDNGNLLPISIFVAAVLIAGSIIYAVGVFNSGNAPKANQAQNVRQPVNSQNFLGPSGRDVVLGDPKAPVTLIEYGDYQCPFCGKFFSETEPLIRENYIKTGKVKMIFRNMAFLGPESTAAAAAAECAKDQQKFWVYHDALYNGKIADGGENSGYFNKNLFVKLAGDAGLDTNSFAACLDNNKYLKTVEDETAQAQSDGVNSTPTVFINGQELQGALPYAQFASAIDSALQKK